ncbi:hypothetical protein E2C01_048077 [Portunus trituberculatus]|uniref:Uncharacterized protein n=1 Tax=Portunus trituberculatus TaxID=210409 RepID=A0A5B7G982_PORTR|nr:hypothetical protein [Portunus trituberculatus]
MFDMSKKNSQIRYPLMFCLHRTVAPPRCTATTTISLFPSFPLNTNEILTAESETHLFVLNA